jgi:hypothetical protein
MDIVPSQYLTGEVTRVGSISKRAESCVTLAPALTWVRYAGVPWRYVFNSVEEPMSGI